MLSEKRPALVHLLSPTFLHDLPPKVTTEAQLGLIGGTMGLLTGFSILSGVEIVYFLLRCLRIPLTSSFSPWFSCLTSLQVS